MDFEVDKIKYIARCFFSFVIVFLFGAVVVHMLVMFIDVTTLNSTHMREHSGLNTYLFSREMIPMMCAYGVLSILVYFFWNAMRKQIRLNHENQLQLKEQQTVLLTIQKITAVMIDYFAVQNNQIHGWVQLRRARKKYIPSIVEDANQKISQGLNVMSQASFSLPYSKDKLPNLNEYSAYLEKQLELMTKMSSSKEPQE